MTRLVTRRAAGACAVLAVLGAVLCALAPASVSARETAGGRGPSRLLVYAQEWSLWPSRASLPAGRVVVQLWNRGQDPHDLRIRRVSASGTMYGRIQGVRVTDPGEISTATWRLSAGRYELYCSLPGHLMRGMHARIRVR